MIELTFVFSYVCGSLRSPAYITERVHFCRTDLVPDRFKPIAEQCRLATMLEF